MKTGLIMEGGAMRGLFTAGVIDVLMENRIEFDGAIGVSAGACFGCNVKSKQIGRVLRYNLRFCKDPRYCSFRSLVKTGDLYGADFCYKQIPDKLDPFDYNTYAENPMEFYVVCTDVETGEPVYKECSGDEPILEWIRASASMPLASRIVEIEGKKLLDGGVSDSIPLKYFKSIGYEKNIVVLTQPENYVKGKNKLMPLMKCVLRKYPALLKTMEERHIGYNKITEYIRQCEKAGDVLVIRPEKALEIGKIEHDPKKIQKTYEEGREAAEGKLTEIKKFLSK